MVCWLRYQVEYVRVLVCLINRRRFRFFLWPRPDPEPGIGSSLDGTRTRMRLVLGGYLIFMDQLIGSVHSGIFFLFWKEWLGSGYLHFLLFKEPPGRGYDLGGRGLVIWFSRVYDMVFLGKNSLSKKVWFFFSEKL